MSDSQIQRALHAGRPGRDPVPRKPFLAKDVCFQSGISSAVRRGRHLHGVVRGFKINSELHSENKSLEQRLVDAEVRLERLGNMEKILESYDPTELQSLLSAATTEAEEQQQEVRPDVDLNKIFIRTDTRQVGVENMQAKLSGSKLSVTFELNNLQAATSITGQADFIFMTKDGTAPVGQDQQERFVVSDSTIQAHGDQHGPAGRQGQERSVRPAPDNQGKGRGCHFRRNVSALSHPGFFLA